MSLFLDHAPIISLLFFLAVFLVVVVRTYRPSSKKTLQSYAFIPLREENNHE